MNKRITFRGMDHSPVIEEFSQRHLERIVHLLTSERTPQHLELTLTAHPVHAHHEIEILVKTPHYDLVARREGVDMYQEIEKTVDVMIKEIKKAKEKYLDIRKNGAPLSEEVE